MQQHGSRPGNPDWTGARSTPTVDGDRLYVLGLSGDLACLQAKDGKVIWRRSLTHDFGGLLPTWRYNESPLVDGDKLICTPGGKDATIVALNKLTGELLWKFVKRNKGQVIAAALVLFVLLAGMAGTTWGLFEARRQEQVARDETAEKEKARLAEAERVKERDDALRLEAQRVQERDAALKDEAERAKERERPTTNSSTGWESAARSWPTPPSASR